MATYHIKGKKCYGRVDEEIWHLTPRLALKEVLRENDILHSKIILLTKNKKKEYESLNIPKKMLVDFIVETKNQILEFSIYKFIICW